MCCLTTPHDHGPGRGGDIVVGVAGRQTYQILGGCFIFDLVVVMGRNHAHLLIEPSDEGNSVREWRRDSGCIGNPGAFQCLSFGG